MTKRDKQIVKYLYDFRFLSTTQIKELLKLSEQEIDIRYLQERLLILYQRNILDRNRNIIYKEYIYNLSDYGYQYYNEVAKRYIKFGGRNLKHELLVADTLIYLCKFKGYSLSDYMTEEDLLLDDIEIVEEESMFNTEIEKVIEEKKYHLGDLVFSNDTVVEVELSRKRKSRLFNNLRQNERNYKKQIWIVYQDDKYIENTVKKFDEQIEVIYIEEVIRTLGRQDFYS